MLRAALPEKLAVAVCVPVVPGSSYSQSACPVWPEPKVKFAIELNPAPIVYVSVCTTAKLPKQPITISEAFVDPADVETVKEVALACSV